MVRNVEENYIMIIGSAAKKNSNPKSTCTKSSYKICEANTDKN